MKPVYRLVTVLIVAALVAVPIGTARADTSPQASTPLETLLKREQTLLGHQQERLDLASAAIATAEEWVTRLKDRGEDTAALESALAAYKSAVAEAQTHFDTAKGILDAKAGFDSNGKVTNRLDALKTVVEVGRAQRQFHLTITPATIDFRAAVRAYRQANK